MVYKSKLIILDGLDACGKTWLINKIKDDVSIKFQRQKVSFGAFPSKKLVETKEFKDLITTENKYDTEVKKIFIDKLIQEEISFFEENKNSDIIFIDRMYFSTLIYQGSGKERFFSMERHIINKYDKMFYNLKIDPERVYHFLFIHKIKDKIVEDASKQNFDNMYDELKIKAKELILNILSGNMLLKSEYLQNITVFDENIFYKKHRNDITREELGVIDAERIKTIYDKIR